jgi:hypothetical protein
MQNFIVCCFQRYMQQDILETICLMMMKLISLISSFIPCHIIKYADVSL